MASSRKRTKAEARPAAALRRVLLFTVGGRLYGCRIEAVREIIPYRLPTRLPGAQEHVLGLINLRGTIVTVTDLGALLHGGEARRSEGSIILVEHRGRVAGIAVDEVMDVRMIPADRIEEGERAGAAVGPGSEAGGAASGKRVNAPTGALAALAQHAPGGAVVGLGHLDDERVVILLDIVLVVSQVLL